MNMRGTIAAASSAMAASCAPLTARASKALVGGFVAWVILSGSASAQQASVLRGHEIAETNCAVCHAVGRTGDSPRPEAPPFRTLSRDFPVIDLEEALTEGISSGSPIMPEFQFSPGDAHALVLYLQSIQDPHTHPAQTGHLPHPLHAHPQ